MYVCIYICIYIYLRHGGINAAQHSIECGAQHAVPDHGDAGHGHRLCREETDLNQAYIYIYIYTCMYIDIDIDIDIYRCICICI